MTRTVVGSFVAASVSLFLFVYGPQPIQQAIAVFTPDGLPETLVASLGLSFLGGFVGNAKRPVGWRALAAWQSGYLGGFLLLFVYGKMTAPIPAPTASSFLIG